MEAGVAIRELRDVERMIAIGWRGATAESRPAAALREVLAELRAKEGDDYELAFSLGDRVAQIRFLALCERYGVAAVHRMGQRRTTFAVRGPKTFIEKVLTPILEKDLRALIPRLDAWLHVIVDGCIRDDLPE